LERTRRRDTPARVLPFDVLAVLAVLVVLAVDDVALFDVLP
jgi:hypothetical protein